ncbi:MAG: NAD-binding protein [Planctomycetes bacterium]|nr:NAD-binding protein [Planctomycetota bacterium]
MKIPGGPAIPRIWQIPAALFLFLLGMVALRELPYQAEPERTPGTAEAAYYSMGLFLGMENPIGFPREGPPWAVWLARLVYFGSPLILASAVIEGVVGFTRRFAKVYLANPEKQVARMDGHYVLCGLGKHGNMLVDLLFAAAPDKARRPDGGPNIVIVERNAENEYLVDMETRRIPVIMGDMTVADTLQRAGIARARKKIAISGDDIANLDAAHIARKLNRDVAAICQVTDVQLQKLVHQAAKLEIDTFNSYDVAAKNLIQMEIRPQVGAAQAPLFVLAGIGRFGRMMAENLIRTFGDRALKILIVDRKGEHIGRVLRGTMPEGEKYFPEGSIYEADIMDPFVWRQIRDENDVSHGTIVICTDNDVSNINTALMIEDQIGRDILVVSRMFRDVSFMEGREGRFKIAVLSKLIEKGILESIGERAPAGIAVGERAVVGGT